MAKFRQNHGNNTSKKVNAVKIILFLAVLGVLLWFLLKAFTNIDFASSEYNIPEGMPIDSSFHIPTGSKGEVIHHKYYSLSYIEKYEQAEWVAYELTKESIRKPNVPRSKRFVDDPLVSTESATYYDYRGSGYSRGHMAPAGDMAFNVEAMKESFFMSNMSPQLSSFNGGVWNELENMVRDWAYKNKRLFVVTGPIFDQNGMESIGKAKVAVPQFYYKVLLDIDNPDRKAIGFILPNERSEKHLREYIVSVDEVERRTGLNFYDNLIDAETQEKLESSVDISKWKFDEKLFRKRIEHWNNR